MATSAAASAGDDAAAATHFEENMTAFYMAFAEQTLEPMCQALGNMRLVVQNDRVDRHARAPHVQHDASVREEMLRACEAKTEAVQPTALAQLTTACAASSADIDAVLTAFFVCTEVGAETQAIEPFARCMAHIFEAQAHASFDRVCLLKRTATVNANGYIDRGFYVEAVSDILTGATDLMNAVADVTTTTSTLLHVLAPVHAAASEIVLDVLHMYELDARMAAWERRALAQARRLPHPSNDKPDAVEADESLQMVDLFLDEASFVLRIIISYCKFLPTIVDGLDGARDSRFRIKTEELSGVYLVLERFYVVQSVHKATAIAEVQELEPHKFVSSIVEDVSFVLNKAFDRASQCMNYHTALSVVIAIVDALESMYLPSILELPKRNFVLPTAASTTRSMTHSTTIAPGASSPSSSSTTTTTTTNDVSFSDMLLQAVDDDLTRSIQDEAKLLMAINSAFVSGEFVQSLATKIESFSTLTFPHNANIVECLPKSIQDLVDVFETVVATETSEILTQSNTRSHLTTRVEAVMTQNVTYVLTPAQYDALGLQGSPLDRLIERDVMQNAALQRYERALCAAPFERVVENFVAELVAALEQALLTTRTSFNDLGALQFEREVTSMLARVATFSPHATRLRARFTRLFQVVLVLNLMDPLHVVDYVASVATELTSDDVATLLRMRVDFGRDAVQTAVGMFQRAIANQ